MQLKIVTNDRHNRNTRTVKLLLMLSISVFGAAKLAAATAGLTAWGKVAASTGTLASQNNPALPAPIVTQLTQQQMFPAGAPTAPNLPPTSYLNAPVIEGLYTPLAIALYWLNSAAFNITNNPSQPLSSPPSATDIANLAALAPDSLGAYNLLLLGAPTGPYDVNTGDTANPPTAFTHVGRSILLPSVYDSSTKTVIVDPVLDSFFTAPVSGSSTPPLTAYPKLVRDTNYLLIKQTDPNFCNDLAASYSAAQGLTGADVLTANTAWVGAVCNPSASEAVLGTGNPNGHCCGNNICDTTNVPASFTNPRTKATIAWPAGYGLCTTPTAPTCSSTTTCGGTSGSSCCNSTAAAPLACCGLTDPDPTTGIAVIACTFNGQSNSGTLKAGATPNCCTPGTVDCCQPTGVFCTENTDCCSGSCNNNVCK